MAKRIGNKVYVNAIVEYSDQGVIRPLSIEWEDGTTYTIARIKHCVPTVSRRGGGSGLMYTCIVDGKEIHLYSEEYGSGLRWCLESKA